MKQKKKYWQPHLAYTPFKLIRIYLFSTQLYPQCWRLQHISGTKSGNSTIVLYSIDSNPIYLILIQIKKDKINYKFLASNLFKASKNVNFRLDFIYYQNQSEVTKVICQNVV